MGFTCTVTVMSMSFNVPASFCKSVASSLSTFDLLNLVFMTVPLSLVFTTSICSSVDMLASLLPASSDERITSVVIRYFNVWPSLNGGSRTNGSQLA